MSEHEKQLAMKFMVQQPAHSATVLESLDPAKVAAAVKQLDVEAFLGPVQHLLPGFSARVLRNLDDSSATKLLFALSAPLISQLLRSMPKEARVPYLSMLGAGKRATVSRLLSFSRETVGAWTATEIFTANFNWTIERTRIELRATNQVVMDRIFVLGKSGALAGTVQMQQVLNGSRSDLIEEIILPVKNPISARTTLAQVQSLPEWPNHFSHPVVERDGRLIGEFSHSGLQRALTLMRRELDSGSDSSMLFTVAGTLGSALQAIATFSDKSQR